MSLRKELETYLLKLPDHLLHEGQFVVIQGDSVAGYWDTYHDALQTAYERYGLSPFLIKKVQAHETVHHITRQFDPCHS